MNRRILTSIDKELDRDLRRIVIFLAIGLALFMGVFGTVFIITYRIDTNVNVVSGTVTDRYVKRIGDSDVFYIVLDDSNVYKNRDSLIWWKFNSADVQARIKMGQRYRFTVSGYRVPFLSMFQNIIDVEEVAHD
jgi:hypothetical protein